MECRRGELSKLVLRSLSNIRSAKTKFRSLSPNLRNAAMLASQIQVRDEVLLNLRRISMNLRRRILRASVATQRSVAVRKARQRRLSKARKK